MPLSAAYVHLVQAPSAPQMGVSSGHWLLEVHLQTPPSQTLPSGQALPQAPAVVSGMGWGHGGVRGWTERRGVGTGEGSLA